MTTTFLLFKATWCAPCKQLDKLLGAMGIEALRVDVDKDLGIAERYKIRSVPVLVKLVDGEEVDRVVGMTNQSNLRRWINE